MPLSVTSHTFTRTCCCFCRLFCFAWRFFFVSESFNRRCGRQALYFRLAVLNAQFLKDSAWSLHLVRFKALVSSHSCCRLCLTSSPHLVEDAMDVMQPTHAASINVACRCFMICSRVFMCITFTSVNHLSSSE